MRRAHIAGILFAALGGTLLLGAPAATAQDAVADAAPNITVTTTPANAEPGCLPPGQAGSVAIDDLATEVVMTVTAHHAICGDVTAAIYAMPNDRQNPWPQTKLEAETFRIGAGVTTVRFAKGCNPVQFDLVTGPTPPFIRPDTGPMHGPMLYEIPWTGVPYWGSSPCPSTTTTSSSTTSTSTSTSTSTTTSPTNVGGVTTTVTVAGVSETRSGTSGGSGTVSGTALAATGVPADLAATWGVVLLAAGLLLLVTPRALALTRPTR